MENLPISTAARRLTPSELDDFDKSGYLQGLPVFAAAAVPQLQKRLHELEAQMPADVPISGVNMWHKANRCLYDLAHTPTILDYV